MPGVEHPPGGAAGGPGRSSIEIGRCFPGGVTPCLVRPAGVASASLSRITGRLRCWLSVPSDPTPFWRWPDSRAARAQLHGLGRPCPGNGERVLLLRISEMARKELILFRGVILLPFLGQGFFGPVTSTSLAPWSRHGPGFPRSLVVAAVVIAVTPMASPATMPMAAVSYDPRHCAKRCSETLRSRGGKTGPERAARRCKGMSLERERGRFLRPVGPLRPRCRAELPPRGEEQDATHPPGTRWPPRVPLAPGGTRLPSL